MKTSELIGPALDWAVAEAEEYERTVSASNKVIILHEGVVDYFDPAENWRWGGPIIERERIQVFPHNGAMEWCGVARAQREGYVALLTKDGPTPLIAAMRCYCCAKLGDEIDIPEELQPCQQPNL